MDKVMKCQELSKKKNKKKKTLIKKVATNSGFIFLYMYVRFHVRDRKKRLYCRTDVGPIIRIALCCTASS